MTTIQDEARLKREIDEILPEEYDDMPEDMNDPIEYLNEFQASHLLSPAALDQIVDIIKQDFGAGLANGEFEMVPTPNSFIASACSLRRVLQQETGE